MVLKCKCHRDQNVASCAAYINSILKLLNRTKSLVYTLNAQGFEQNLYNFKAFC